MATMTSNGAIRLYLGSEKPTVDYLSLDINDEEFLVLVGPSGCDKSTSLRMPAGLEQVDDETVCIGNDDVTYAPPKDRDIVMVFQNYALYPHITVADNMGFALKIQGVPRGKIHGRVADAAKILDLEPYLDRKPKTLSGGQCQRVTMGRTIVRESRIFLTGEPLSNLDAELHAQTRTQTASLQKRLGITIVCVTHDQTKALMMGDRVAVLKDGLLQQVGMPNEMYSSPANAFTTGFIGSPAMNLGRWHLAGNAAIYGDSSLPVPSSIANSVTREDNGQIIVGFRPETLSWNSNDMYTPGSDEDVPPGKIPLKVTLVEELGSDACVCGHVVGADREVGKFGSGDGSNLVTIRIEPDRIPVPGEVILVEPNPDQIHFFSTSGGERINWWRSRPGHGRTRPGLCRFNAGLWKERRRLLARWAYPIFA